MLLHYKILGIGFIPFAIAMAFFAIYENSNPDVSESEIAGFGRTILPPGESLHRKLIWSDSIVHARIYPGPSDVDIEVVILESDGKKFFSTRFQDELDTTIYVKPGSLYELTITNLDTKNATIVAGFSNSMFDESGNFVFNLTAFSLLGLGLMGIAVLIFIIAFVVSIKERR